MDGSGLQALLAFQAAQVPVEQTFRDLEMIPASREPDDVEEWLAKP